MPEPVVQAQASGSAPSSPGPVLGKPCPRALSQGPVSAKTPGSGGSADTSLGFRQDAARQVRHDPTRPSSRQGAAAGTEPPEHAHT